MIVAKYKFDKSIYSNLIPIFNNGYTGYTVNDVVDSSNSNHIIRTIECDTLPTVIRFGNNDTSTDTTAREHSLLYVHEVAFGSNIVSVFCMFRGCKNLTNIEGCDKWDTSNITNMSGMFNNCTNLTSLDVSNFNTSNVTDMNTMFHSCTNLTTLDLSNFDTKNVTSMTSMFYDCNKLTTLDVSNFNTSNVTSMNSMFYNCQSLTSLDVSNFNTSNVNTMGSMFDNCQSLTSLDVSNFDTSNVTTMSYMFQNCFNLTSLDVSNFNTNKVTSMQSMFNNCNKLTSLDVSNFDTKNVTNMFAMFNNCNNLTSLDVSNWNTSKVTDMNCMFYRCFKLKHAHMSGWNTPKVRNVRSMFAGCESIEIIDMHNFDFKNAYNDTGELFKYDMFQLKYLRINDLLGNDYAIDMIPSRTGKEQGVLISDAKLSEETLTKLEAKNWTIVTSDTLTKVAEYVYDSNTWNSMIPEFNDEFIDYFIDDIEDENGLVTRIISSMGGLPTLMRFGLDSEYVEKALISVDYLNTGNLTSMKRMFKQCSNLISVNTEGWNTSNVTNMKDMFADCTNLTSLDLSNFDTSKVTDIEGMFCECQSLTSLDASNWDTSEVITMQSIFYNCRKLTLLDVSNWDTSNVTNMRSTFNTCIRLASLDVSNWNTSNVTDMKNMFCYCSDLITLDVSNFDTSNVTDMYKMFYKCSDLISLDLSNFDTSKVTDMGDMFNSTSELLDIGMLYCTPSTINAIASALLTTHTQTIWVQDADINKLTSVSGVEFKEYKENSYMINLSSPLLNGDRIEVVDGKLCHYHKMGKVVLDGSEDEEWRFDRVFTSSGYYSFFSKSNLCLPTESSGGYCDTIPFLCAWNIGKTHMYVEHSGSTRPNMAIIEISASQVEPTKESICSWLQANPTTAVYELAEPYYEDITPLQSDIALETYLECNLDIYTKLPIKTNVSYITNVPSLSTLSMRATEMKESDNIIANLTNMLDNEINE